MDTFHDLWIQYEDGRWRWISLISLLDQKAYHRLARREIFRAGTLSADQRWIEWPKSLRLHVDHLEGAPGVLTLKGVVVRAEGDTAHGWFRPLWIWHPKEVRRQRLIGRPDPQHQNDVLTLQWLGWSEAELEIMFQAYSVTAHTVAARLLDLTLYLDVTTLAEAGEFRRWLDLTWVVPGYATPREAIEAGDIALIERMYVNPPARMRVPVVRGQ